MIKYDVVSYSVFAELKSVRTSFTKVQYGKHIQRNTKCHLQLDAFTCYSYEER